MDGVDTMGDPSVEDRTLRALYCYLYQHYYTTSTSYCVHDK